MLKKNTKGSKRIRNLKKDLDFTKLYSSIDAINESKSGSKVKYYYCKNNSVNPIFAYMRGSYPMEFAPEIDYDEQFMKAILSPINSIIAPLGLPEITKRLSVVIDIFSGI